MSGLRVFTSGFGLLGGFRAYHVPYPQALRARVLRPLGPRLYAIKDFWLILGLIGRVFGGRCGVRGG